MNIDKNKVLFKNKKIKPEFLIHTCKNRAWYVYNFLVPELKRQGVCDERIKIYNDDNMDGNLKAYLNSIDLINKYNDVLVVNLQDDMWISEDFVQFVESLSSDYSKIYNLFCCFYDGNNKHNVGFVDGHKSWFSFGCIIIHNSVMLQFLDWMHSTKVQNKYKNLIASNKNDDLLFKNFLIDNNMKSFNVGRSLVENVDTLIGGSSINKRDFVIHNSYWTNKKAIEQLADRINKYSTIHNI